MIHLRPFKSLSPNIVKPTHLRCFLHDKKNTYDQEPRKHYAKLCQVQGVVHNRVLIGRTFILPGTIFVDEGSSTSQNVPMSWAFLVKINKKSEH